MATVAEYPDAVRRIVNAHVDPNATTEAEVQAALSAADAPQVTPKVARDAAEAILTEDKVLDALEGTGELPTEGEIGAATRALDDYGMTDRQRAVDQEVSDRVVTLDDVEREVSTIEGDRVFREDVESAVERAGSGREFVGQSRDQTVDDQARSVGAPRRTSFERERAQTVARGEQIAPADVLDDTEAQTPVTVIRDSGGDPVAATGGPSDSMGAEVARELGADYMSREEVVESMDVSGSGSSVDLTLRGRKVGEVDVA